MRYSTAFHGYFSLILLLDSSQSVIALHCRKNVMIGDSIRSFFHETLFWSLTSVFSNFRVSVKCEESESVIWFVLWNKVERRICSPSTEFLLWLKRMNPRDPCRSPPFVFPMIAKKWTLFAFIWFLMLLESVESNPSSRRTTSHFAPSSCRKYQSIAKKGNNPILSSSVCFPNYSNNLHRFISFHSLYYALTHSLLYLFLACLAACFEHRTLLSDI